jgi:hypothetical protein
MGRKWNAPPLEADSDHCGSFPHCDLPPLPGRRFCLDHQALLDRVRESISGRKYTTAPIAPSVKLSHVPAARKPKSGPGRGLAFQRDIIEALKAGERTSAELASAVGTTSNDKSYSRARKALVAAGVVLDLGRQGRNRLYGLTAST